MFLVFSLPVGLHHLFADPEHGSGFKFLQSFLTFFVALTLLTVFSVSASLEIAGVCAAAAGSWLDPGLPWHEPMVLAVALSLVMLASGGFGGSSHELCDELHDPQHVLGDRAFPPHLRRRRRDMYLRSLTRCGAHQREATAIQGAGTLATLAVVLGMMIPRSRGTLPADGTAAARRHLRLQRPVHRRMGPLVIIIRHRRPDPAGVCGPLIVILVRSQLGATQLAAPLRYALAVNPATIQAPAHRIP